MGDTGYAADVDVNRGRRETAQQRKLSCTSFDMHREKYCGFLGVCAHVPCMLADISD